PSSACPRNSASSFCANRPRPFRRSSARRARTTLKSPSCAAASRRRACRTKRAARPSASSSGWPACSRARPSAAWASAIWSGSRACRGARPTAARSTSAARATCWTRTITISTRSRTASSSTWRCASCARSAARRPRRRGSPATVPRGSRFSASWGRRAWARPVSARASPARSAASSCACRWAACATRRRSAAIATQYLVPKQLAAHGLRAGELVVEPDAIRVIVRRYTREAGVRNLERELAAVARKVARRLAEGQAGPFRVGVENLDEYLGRPRFFDDVVERTSRPGVATGLAWTPVGGDVLFVEVTMMPASEERLILTGMLGDVMRESAQTAVSYVWSNAEAFGIDPKLFEGRTVHIHVPAGAIPKDGPSAGVTMVTALASYATRRPVRNDAAMTGEITLRGKVLPVGGIKEKVLAAHRVGIRTVILPRHNERDLEDVPAEVRS